MKEPTAGTTIQEHVAAMVEAARRNTETVHSEFNGIPLVAGPDSEPAAIVSTYFQESNRRVEEYRRSPEYAEQQRKSKEREDDRTAKLEQALAGAPASPTWKDAETWQKSVAANQDGYGGAVMTYAERWARAMEGAIAAGKTVEECADELAHVCDSEGITGFMYGCAVSILSACWQYGEELRRWHNLKTQFKDEGKRANESGGVLNPAVLSIFAGPSLV